MGGSRGKGTRRGDTPVSPPDWVWQLPTGEYVPTHEWDMLLKGYENWHIVGASFINGKGQGPDYKNWGVTLPSVAMSLRRFDEGNSGGVVDATRILGRGHSCVSSGHLRLRAIDMWRRQSRRQLSDQETHNTSRRAQRMFLM